MVYMWESTLTGKRVEVERKMAESDREPTLKEATAQGLTEEEAEQTKWKKIVKGGSFTKNFGGKGKWQHM